MLNEKLSARYNFMQSYDTSDLYLHIWVQIKYIIGSKPENIYCPYCKSYTKNYISFGQVKGHAETQTHKYNKKEYENYIIYS